MVSLLMIAMIFLLEQLIVISFLPFNQQLILINNVNIKQPLAKVNNFVKDSGKLLQNCSRPAWHTSTDSRAVGTR